MRILVLGSEGQIGKPVCKFLKENGHDVIRYDIKISETHDLRVIGSPLQNELFQECDFVYYFASDVGGAKYLEANQDSFDFIMDNIQMMETTFCLLRKYQKPFIFTSSQMAAQPHSTYGNLKLVGERFTKALGGICVRLWNVYGKEEENEKSHVITDFIKQAEENGKIICRTNGQEQRQFLHAEDLAKALLCLTDRYAQINRRENIDISSFEWCSIEEIAWTCGDIFNVDYELSNSQDENQKNYKNEPNRKILEFWKPSINIREGIQKIINE
ncbi:NAD(P)-dependent oxidoreductase [bacterium]|nr:NAD(P)-dependent oxidoreductase [bacterium]